MRGENMMTGSIANLSTVTKIEVQTEMWGTKVSVCCSCSFDCGWKIQHVCVLIGMIQGGEDELSYYLNQE